jgi:predicted DNA-binding transcriptional regulator AlpA
MSTTEPMPAAEPKTSKRRARVLPMKSTGNVASATVPPTVASPGTDAGPVEPILVGVDVVAAILSMSERTVYREADANPEFPQPRKWGERKGRDGKAQARFTRWVFAEVREFALRRFGHAGSGGPQV